MRRSAPREKRVGWLHTSCPDFSFQHSWLSSAAAFYQLFSNFLENKTGFFHMCSTPPRESSRYSSTSPCPSKRERPSPPWASVSSSSPTTSHQEMALCVSRCYSCFLLGFCLAETWSFSGDIIRDPVTEAPDCDYL